MRNTFVLVRSKSFPLALETEGRRSLRGVPKVSFLEGLFEEMQSCKSLGFTRGSKGEGLQGGLSALCNAIWNAACCMLVVSRSSVRDHTSQKCPPILRWTPPPIAQQYHWGLCTTKTSSQPHPLLASLSGPPGK